MSATTNRDLAVLESSKTGTRFLLIPGWILTLAILALGVIQSGKPSHLLDPSGALFVLVGGIALAMISFPFSEIRRALRVAVRIAENEADTRGAVVLWEAVGRGFWILGALRGILHIMMFFFSISTLQYGTLKMLIEELSQSLVPVFYGVLGAVLCFIPWWKLTGRLGNRPLAPAGEQGPIPTGRSGWRFGAAFGYVLMILLLVSFFFKVPGLALCLMGLKPAFLAIVGGTTALMLIRGSNSGLTLSTALAAMGIIGCLIGSIQMQGHVAGAFSYLLSSCLTALLGIILVAAPLEDRAVRTGRVAARPAFSRAAWYLFPLFALMLLVPMVFVLTIPGLG